MAVKAAAGPPGGVTVPIYDTSSTDQIRWIVTDSEAVMFVVETPKIRLCFSGGGPLGERFTHLFAGIGVQVYEGDGLTETSPTLTSARPGACLARALTIESGELTATLKVRRAVVEQSYADDIDRIYAR